MEKNRKEMRNRVKSKRNNEKFDVTFRNKQRQYCIRIVSLINKIKTFEGKEQSFIFYILLLFF